MAKLDIQNGHAHSFTLSIKTCLRTVCSPRYCVKKLKFLIPLFFGTPCMMNGGKNRLIPELLVNLFYTGLFIQKVPWLILSSGQSGIFKGIKNPLTFWIYLILENPLFLMQNLPFKIKRRNKIN